MSVRRIVVNSKVGGPSSPSPSPFKKPAGDSPSPSYISKSSPSPSSSSLLSSSTTSTASLEEITFLKSENTRLEAELKASVDNLLIVVDEVKFLEEEADNKRKEVITLKTQVTTLSDQVNNTQLKAQAEQASGLIVANDLKKQIQDLLDQKNNWNSAEAQLNDNLKALESQLSQEKKRRNELQEDRKLLIDHLTKHLPDTDVPKILGHSLDEDIVLAALPEGSSLPLESLLDLPPFTSDIDGLKRQLFEAHRRLESLHSEYKSLQQDVTHSHDVIKNVSNDNDTQVSKWEHINKDLTQENENLSKTIESLKKETYKLEQIAQTAEKFLKEAQIKNTELEKSMAVKEEEVKSVNQLKIKFQEEASRDKDVVRQLEQLLKKAREQLLALQADNNSLRGSLPALDQIMLERDDLVKKLSDFQKEKETLAVELTDTAKQMDDEFSKITKEKEDLAKELAVLKEEKNKILEDSEKSKAALQQDGLKLSQEKKKIEEDKIKLEEELASLTKANTQLWQNFEKFQTDKALVDKSLTNTKEELVMTREELRKVMAHNQSFLRSIASVRSTNESKTELEDLRTQLSDALTSLHSLEQELFDTKQLSLKYKQQLEELQQNIVKPTSPLTIIVPSSPSPSPVPPSPSISSISNISPISTISSPPPIPPTPKNPPLAPLAPLGKLKPRLVPIAVQNGEEINEKQDEEDKEIEKINGKSSVLRYEQPTLSPETLKKLLDEERWKLEEAIRESSDLALKLRETEELLRKENTIVLNKLEKALLVSQQVGEKHAKTVKENGEIAGVLADTKKELEVKEIEIGEKEKVIGEKERELERMEYALASMAKEVDDLKKSKLAPPTNASAPPPPLLKTPKQAPKLLLPIANKIESKNYEKGDDIDDLSFDFDTEADLILASMLDIPPTPSPPSPILKAPKPFKPKTAIPLPGLTPSPFSPPFISTTPPPPSHPIATSSSPAPPMRLAPKPPASPSSSQAPNSALIDSFAYSELTESERQVRDLENVINNLKNDLLEARSFSDKLNLEKQGLQKDITRLQKSLEDQEKSKASATSIVTEQVKKLESENSDLKKKLESAQLEVVDYRKRLEEAQERFALAKENLLFMQQMKSMRGRPEEKESEKTKEREKEQEKETDRDRDRGKSRERRGREKSRGRERERERRSRGASIGKERGREWERDRSESDGEREGDEIQRTKPREESFDNDRERERERDVERAREREREVDRARERAAARLREEERDRERERERQKDKEWEQEKDKIRNKDIEREKERIREREKDIERERERERAKEREMERGKEREKEEEQDVLEKERLKKRENDIKDTERDMAFLMKSMQEGGKEAADQHYKDIFYNQVVERLEKELSILQKENQDLRNSVLSYDPIEENLLMYEEKFAALADENQMLKQDIDALESERNDMVQEVESLRQQLQELITEREALAEQFENVYRETVDRLENEIKQAKEASKDLSFESHTSLDDMHLKLNNMALSTKIHTLEQQIETLTQDLSRANTAKAEVEVKLREQMQQVRELQREKTAASEALASKSLEFERKTLEYEKSESKSRSVDHKLTDLQKETERLQKEIDRLQKETDRLQQELFSEKSRATDSEKGRVGLENRLRDFERNATDFERWGNTLQQEIDKTKETHTGVTHELREAQATVDRLLKDNLDLERKLFEKDQLFKEASSKMMGPADIEKLNSIMFEAHTDTGSLKHRTAELQSSRLIAKLQDQLKNVTLERDNLQAKLRDLKIELKESQRKSAEVFQSMGKFNVDNVALALENRLAEAHRKLQLVEQENSDLHHLLVDSQLSLNEYAQDVEEQMLQYTPHAQSTTRPHTPLTLHNLSSRSSHNISSPPLSSRSSYGDYSFTRSHSRGSMK